MSQAHYLRCRYLFAPKVAPGVCGTAIAFVGVWGGPPEPHCARCLNLTLNSVDDLLEDVDGVTCLVWIFDAGIPQCGIHHWPAELCEGWSHRALIEQLRATYADERPSARSDDPT